SKSEIAAEEDVLQCLTANHTGYRGIKHERIVTVYANEKWLVEDKLTRRRAASHVYRLHWLLPDWEWKLENREQRSEISLLSPSGWMTILLQTQPLLSDDRLPVSLVRAGEVVYGERDVKPYEGWASPTYGVKVPALSLAIEVTSLWNVTFTTKFVFPE
ncbi:MAG: heparinase II/III-family protein, partial [Anaerolineales bacterium]|nr:heparinase II/III-family protein [Anaerolineales bacterium]